MLDWKYEAEEWASCKSFSSDDDEREVNVPDVIYKGLNFSVKKS